MSLIPFQFDDLQLRAITDDLGEPWFVAGDVAAALGYRDAPTLTRILDEDEKGTHLVCTLGGDQESTVISESGLYNAIFNSRRPEAKRFRKWVTGEVLPSIRKTGAYAMVPAPTAPANPYQLTADEAEQVAVLGNVAAAFMAEVSGLLYSTFERAQENGLTAAAANKYAVAIVNVRMRELEKFRKERQEALVRAQKHTDKAVSAVSARLHKQLDTEELTIDEYLEKISHARRVLVNSGKQLLLS